MCISMAERDYAKEFKDSFSISEIGKALEILNEWNDLMILIVDWL